MEVKFKLKTANHLEMISLLFYWKIQAHIFHLQVESYSAHQALGEFYTDLTPIVDKLAETLQGKLQTIFKNYTSIVYKNFISVDIAIKDLQEFKQKVEDYRLSLDKSFANVDNQMQELVDLVESTMYKLRFLK